MQPVDDLFCWILPRVGSNISFVFRCITTGRDIGFSAPDSAMLVSGETPGEVDLYSANISLSVESSPCSDRKYNPRNGRKFFTWRGIQSDCTECELLILVMQPVLILIVHLLCEILTQTMSPILYTPRVFHGSSGGVASMSHTRTWYLYSVSSGAVYSERFP